MFGFPQLRSQELWLLEPDRANNGARRTLLRAVVQDTAKTTGHEGSSSVMGEGSVPRPSEFVSDIMLAI